jgi:hypothetical protein
MILKEEDQRETKELGGKCVSVISLIKPHEY